jgi:hypothetical protein
MSTTTPLNVASPPVSLNPYEASATAEANEPQSASSNGSRALPSGGVQTPAAATALADPLAKFAAFFGLHAAAPPAPGGGVPQGTPRGSDTPSAPTYGGPGKTSLLECHESGLDDAPTTKVQPGESSLEQVAERVGLDPEELVRANPRIKDPALLSAGQSIRLPEEAKLSARPDVEWPQCPTDTNADPRREVAEAHRIYKETGQVPQTQNQRAPIEIKEGRLMSRAERYDAMLAEQGKANPQVNDLVRDKRDPDYLTKQEFHDEFFKREEAEWKRCRDDYIRPGKIDKCQSAVLEKYGGPGIKEWRDDGRRVHYQQWQHAERQIDAIKNSGPIGLAGRGVGHAIDGLKGQEVGGVIGDLGDTALALRSGARQRANQRSYNGPAGLELRREAPANVAAASPAAPAGTPETPAPPAAVRRGPSSEPAAGDAAAAPKDYVVAFGRAGLPERPWSYMADAARNTGLTAINIQDRINVPRGLGSHFPSSYDAEMIFAAANRPGGLHPMFSGYMTQEALAGKAAAAVHFDVRGVELTPRLPDTRGPDGRRSLEALPGFSLADLHSSSELRQGVAHLASTGPGERKVNIYLHHECGVTLIKPDSNVAYGAPLPKDLADRMPNITASAAMPRDQP